MDNPWDESDSSFSEETKDLTTTNVNYFLKMYFKATCEDWLDKNGKAIVNELFDNSNRTPRKKSKNEK